MDYAQLHQRLQQIEEQLQRLGWWDAQPPSPEALASTLPFHADTLSFEAWLQWIFLPRMGQLIDHRQPLPGPSGLAPMGEVCWRDRPEARPLIELLREVDELLAP